MRVQALLAAEPVVEVDYLPSSATPAIDLISVTHSDGGGCCLGLPWALLPLLHARARELLRGAAVASLDAAEAASAVLLASPFDGSAWNARKARFEALEEGVRPGPDTLHDMARTGAHHDVACTSWPARCQRQVELAAAEQRFTRAILSRHPKAAEAWAHLSWLASRQCAALLALSVQSSPPMPGPCAQLAPFLSLLLRDLSIVEAALTRRPRNYHAWRHRLHTLECLLEVTAREPRARSALLCCLAGSLPPLKLPLLSHAAPSGAADGDSPQGDCLAWVRLVRSELSATRHRVAIVGDPSAASYRAGLLRLLLQASQRWQPAWRARCCMLVAELAATELALLYGEHPCALQGMARSYHAWAVRGLLLCAHPSLESQGAEDVRQLLVLLRAPSAAAERVEESQLCCSVRVCVSDADVAAVLRLCLSLLERVSKEESADVRCT